jgi:hypothetical protein
MIEPMAEIDDFYEPDEPVEHVIQAFERGEQGVTGRVTWSYTDNLKIPGRFGRLIGNLANKSTKELHAH